MIPSIPSRTLDCHAHYVSPLALRSAREHPERYGVHLEAAPTGGERAVMGGEGPRRSFPPELLALSDRGERLPGITHQVVGPWMDMSGYRLPEGEAARWCSLINDAFAEDVANTNGTLRFTPLATMPMQVPKTAARELERCVASHNFRGAMIGTNIDGLNLDEPRFDPVWQQAQELRVPVVLHPYHVLGADRLGRYWLENAIGNPTDTTVAAASLIFGGVLDRFPDLQFVLVHGGGFFPYQRGRLDQARRTRPEANIQLSQMPSDYVRRFLYDSIVFSPGALRYLVDTVGADRVMLGSDYPFDMGDPTPVSTLEQARFEPEVARTVRAAARLPI